MAGQRISVLIHGLIGWAVCGATVAIGRQFVSMGLTLTIHAIVAPAAFGILTWRHTKAHPNTSAGSLALAMLGIVVGLDALLVAPFLERSYAMFRSVLGTWLPFALIFASTYVVARRTGRGDSLPNVK